MDREEVKQIQEEIKNALNEKRIKDALSLIGGLTKDFQSGSLIDEHYNIEFTYKSLLSYTLEGVKDPEQQVVYNKIISDLLTLSDKLFSFINTQESYEYIYEKRRALNRDLALSMCIEELYNDIEFDIMTAQSGQKTNKVEDSMIQLFNFLLSVESIKEEEQFALVKLLSDEKVNYAYRSVFVSALTVGLLQEFSESKILVLFDLITASDQEIKHRALVGLILVLYKYDERLKYSININRRLKQVTDNNHLMKTIVSLLINLIRTRETEKITTKLNEEILPEVVKMHPNMQDKLGIEDMISEKFMEGENPDWEDFFKDSPELKSKLEEITEWQLEGADVFLSTFKTLKHFPFFNDIHNWLIPFYLANPVLTDFFNEDKHIFGSSAIQESLTNSGFLCNSDKYSLFLSVPFMPSFQKDMMGKMFEQQLEQMDDIEKDESLVKPDKKEANISNRYIQDLYRFYKLYPKHNQFEDVFSWDMSFYNKYFFKQIFTEDTYLRQVGEFYFKKQYYAEAVEVFSMLLAENSNHVELAQKMAYSMQKVGDYEGALKWYLRADILKPDQVWTIKKIALMYKYKGDAEKALQHYLHAEKIKPEDLHTQALIGHCHLDLMNYKQALQYYFKVEYMDRKNTKVWSPIAWCSFVSGNLEQAEKYYQKLIIASSNDQDIINMGHVYLCMNDRKQALSYYKKAIMQMQNKEEFFQTMQEDTSHLILNGVDIADMPIIIDQLKYSLEE